MRNLFLLCALLQVYFVQAQKDSLPIWINLTIEIRDLDTEAPINNQMITIERDDKEMLQVFTNETGISHIDTCEHFILPGHDYTIKIHFRKHYFFVNDTGEYETTWHTFSSKGLTKSTSFYKVFKARERPIICYLAPTPEITFDKTNPDSAGKVGEEHLLQLMKTNPGLIIKLCHLSKQTISQSIVLKRLNHVSGFLIQNGIHPERIQKETSSLYSPGQDKTCVTIKIVAFDFDDRQHIQKPGTK